MHKTKWNKIWTSSFFLIYLIKSISSLSTHELNDRYTQILEEGSLNGTKISALILYTVVTEFELQSTYYFHFCTNNFKENINSLTR